MEIVANSEKKTAKMEKMNRWHWLAFSLILLVGTLLRLLDLGGEDYSYDEVIMVYLTQDSWATAWDTIAGGRPPVTVVLGYLWVHLFGASEAATRSLSVVAGVVSIALLFWVGREWFGRRVGLAAAFLLAISGFHLYYSQDYRYYSLLVMGTLLSFLFFARFLRMRRRRDGVLYVASSLLMFYTHSFGVLALLAQGIYALWNWRDLRGMRRAWVISQAAILLGMVPMLVLVAMDYLSGSMSGALGVMGPMGPLKAPPLWLPLHTLLVAYLFRSVDNVNPYIVGGVLLVSLAVVWLVRRRAVDGAEGGRIHNLPLRASVQEGWSKITRNRLLLLVGLWLMLPIFVPYVASLLIAPMYAPRYTISALPAFCLLLAVLMVAVRRLVPMALSATAAAVLVAPALYHYVTADVKPQWSRAVAYVEAHAQPGDALMFVSINNEPAERIQNAFVFYSGGTLALPVCSDPDLLYPPRDLAQAMLARCLENHERIWLVTREVYPEHAQMIADSFFPLSEQPERAVGEPAAAFAQFDVAQFNEVRLYLLAPGELLLPREVVGQRAKD